MLKDKVDGTLTLGQLQAKNRKQLSETGGDVHHLMYSVANLRAPAAAIVVQNPIIFDHDQEVAPIVGVSAAAIHLHRFEEKVKHQIEGLARDQFMRSSDPFTLRPLEQEAEDAVSLVQQLHRHLVRIALMERADNCRLMRSVGISKLNGQLKANVATALASLAKNAPPLSHRAGSHFSVDQAMHERVHKAHAELEETSQLWIEPSRFRKDHFQPMKLRKPDLAHENVNLFGVDTNALYDLDRKAQLNQFKAIE